ncbi:MAG: PadR family transcriptional regulator [Gaiellaceae bacterium]
MRDSNPTRLLILGLLAAGPMHGHQIRHSAELGDIERWGGVKVGSLYGMLHRLELEGLIEEARSEQEGRRPARTVYAITHEGLQELSLHRERALTSPDVGTTTVEVALKWAAGSDAEELRQLLSRRRGAIASRLEELRAGRELYARRGVLPPASIAGYRRSELHLEAELRWHEEIEASLPEMVSQAESPKQAAKAPEESPERGS